MKKRKQKSVLASKSQMDTAAAAALSLISGTVSAAETEMTKQTNRVGNTDFGSGIFQSTTELPVEKETEAPVENLTEAITEVPVETPTEVITEDPMETPTEAITEAPGKLQLKL